MIIESSPTNLDPRVGRDAQSERIYQLIFDALLTRGKDLSVEPGLAQRWENPDPLTYVFHLHPGVHFHDGRPLTSRDVKWTFDSLLQGKIPTSKADTYRFVDHIDAPDPLTVVFHMKEPFGALLWNLSEGAVGIVPFGSGAEVSQHPIGTGPFRFVSAELDKQVILERNPDYWGAVPHIARIRFMVVPDENTIALELRKGSADAAMNAVNPDIVLTLENDPRLAVLRAPGSVIAYLTFNMRDPILRDVGVRQAIAYAIDRQPIIDYLLRGFARPAASVLPTQSWAYDGNVPHYEHDPAKARALLDAAGYPAHNGVRFHLTMKTSSQEGTRLLVAVLQQQLRDVGIVLDIRTFEFATFYADVTRGLFQLYSMRWIGGNEDPDIFEYVFHSSKTPPKGGNRGFYKSARVDALIDQARREVDPHIRKELYDEVQQILAEEVPALNLWYLDNVLICNRRIQNVSVNISGDFNFLKTADISPVPQPPLAAQRVAGTP